MTLIPVQASPTTDDEVSGLGCITTVSGGRGTFQFEASFDVDTHTQTGQINYTDASAGVQASSSTLVDYADVSATMRGLTFSANAATHNEIRLYVSDNGTATDTFEIQLLQGGNIVYQAGGELTAACGGGIDVDTGEGVSCAVSVSVTWKFVEQGKVEFTYTIKNQGSVDITTLTVVDNFGAIDLSEVEFPIQPGESIMLSVVESVSGPVVNKVKVTANGQGSNGCTAEAQGVIRAEDFPASNPGTGTPGYWKNHSSAWPVNQITIGGKTYAKKEAIMIMKRPVRDDKTQNMFAQLVSAILNTMIGNESSCIDSTITSAQVWMTKYPVGSKVKASSKAWGAEGGGTIHSKLDAYNNGRLCAPARD